MKKQETQATKHPLYETWRSMRTRCNRADHKHYKTYGGRGITVCDRWDISDGKSTGFLNFLADMGDKPSDAHTLERINNDGPYSPDNCCWATWDVQQANKNRKNKPLPGERNPAAKLSDWDAIEIRWLSGWGVKGATLARAYNVSAAQISKIVLRQNFRHLR